MELRFDVILYSKLGNENSDSGHIKCSRGPQVPHPWCNTTQFFTNMVMVSFYMLVCMGVRRNFSRGGALLDFS